MKNSTLCFFVSDLHGRYELYQKLFREIRRVPPMAVFLGGDLLPSSLLSLDTFRDTASDFINSFLIKELHQLKKELKKNYPRIFVILGNDDSREEEEKILDAEKQGLWDYVHKKKLIFYSYHVYGYAYIPPSPFLLKDWERYDVSRFVDPGSVSPEEGFHSVEVSHNEIKYSTIAEDIKLLAGDADLSQAIFLFHAPPYETNIDRAALDGKKVDHVPLDLHVGSVAIQRFIEERQPMLTLHGHIHESARLTHSWKDRIGKTHMFSAAHDGPELALVRFNLEDLDQATRQLL
jgi:Icc-related predicted phosphoesterase